MYNTVIYLIFERGISFLTILKLFEISGFKQTFVYLKNKKINLIKVILKLECLFYQNIYICCTQSSNFENLKIDQNIYIYTLHLK